MQYDYYVSEDEKELLLQEEEIETIPENYVKVEYSELDSYDIDVISGYGISCNGISDIGIDNFTDADLQSLGNVLRNEYEKISQVGTDVPAEDGLSENLESEIESNGKDAVEIDKEKEAIDAMEI